MDCWSGHARSLLGEPCRGRLLHGTRQENDAGGANEAKLGLQFCIRVSGNVRGSEYYDLRLEVRVCAGTSPQETAA